MLLELVIAGVVLTYGSVQFRHFEPRMPLWRRVVKVALLLAMTAAVSHFFGRRGVVIAFGLALLPVIYLHAIWLPRHGVNGWTGEPREKYYKLRGWPL